MTDKMRLGLKVCTVIVIGLGVVCIVFGLTLGLLAENLYSKLYQEKLELTPSSASHKLWSHTPVPLYLEVYLFNWSNVNEFVDHKAVPQFTEVGPFVFSEVHDRVNVVWNDNNTVTYNQTRKWNFIPELSQDLSVKVTNLNVIATTLGQKLKKFSKFKSVLSWLFRAEHLTNTASAKEWIFEGIDDKLLEYISVLEHVFNIPTSPKTKFAWFYERNMSSSYDGSFTVHTGTDNIYKVGMMDRWNGMNQTGYFNGTCGLVNGTSGELFPPMNSAASHINIFISDICSSLKLFYNGTSTVDGIELYKYVGKKISFDNGQYNPMERCNCIDKCIPNGVRDGSTCKNAPIYFSFPHFYSADASYRRRVSGMVPKSEHEFMILLDPVTGMPFDVRAQLQINVHIEQIPWLNIFSNVPEIYIPMMWFRQRAKITPELESKAYFLHIFPQAMAGFSYGLLAFGFLIIIIHVFVVWRNRKRHSDSELLIPPMIDEDVNIRAK